MVWYESLRGVLPSTTKGALGLPPYRVAGLGMEGKYRLPVTKSL